MVSTPNISADVPVASLLVKTGLNPWMPGGTGWGLCGKQPRESHPSLSM